MPESSAERHFSHSSMGTWRRCKVKYKWSYIDNYFLPQSLGQLRGSAGHASFANWYTLFDEEKAVETAEKFYNDFEINTGQDVSSEWDLTELILRRYFPWSVENDDFEEVVSLEQKFEIKIGNHTVIGYIDGIVKAGESIWLLENKFNKKVDTKSIDIDMQVSIYLLACYKLGIDARGVLYNIVRVAEGGIAQTQPVVRRKIFRNQAGLAFIEQELAIQLDEMAKYHSKGGLIYRNETRDCSWDCGFYQACLAINDDGNVASALSSYKIAPPIELKGENGE